MKRKTPLPWYLCTLMMLLLVGCNQGNPVSDISTPTPELDRFSQSLLSDEPCPAPCWYDLKLGESTKDEILSTLRTLSFIDAATITEQEGFQYWDEQIQDVVPGELLVVNCTGEPGFYCVVFILVEDTLMEMILTPPGFISFDRITAHLGDPDYVSIDPPGPEQRGCELRLLWIERQVVLEGPNLEIKPGEQLCQRVREGKKLDPGLVATRIFYQMPNSYLLTHTDQGNYFPWPGLENR